MKKNSVKYSRMSEEVHHALSKILASGEIKDPRVHPMTTVMGVDVTTDLKYCKVYVSVLGDEKDLEDTIKGLTSASHHVRYLLAKSLNLRNTPELTFLKDESIAYGVNMSKMIDEINKPLHEREEVEDGGEG